MDAKNPTRASDRVVEQSMAAIEKGQQLAGHYPSADALDSARRILTGELSPEDGELELNAALAQLVERARSANDGL
jgi:hypothetical protein